MSTPLNANVTKTSTCKGINKSLLTPCRRIGLPRRRKTPNNLCDSLLGFKDNVSVTSSSIHLSENAHSTGMTKHIEQLKTDDLVLDREAKFDVNMSSTPATVKRLSIPCDDNLHLPLTNDAKKRKTKIADEFENRDDTVVSNSETKRATCPQDSNGLGKSGKENSDVKNNRVICENESRIEKEHKENRIDAAAELTSSKCVEELNNKNLKIENSENLHNPVGKVRTTRCKRKLSMKRSISSQDDLADTDDDLDVIKPDVALVKGNEICRPSFEFTGDNKSDSKSLKMCNVVLQKCSGKTEADIVKASAIIDDILQSEKRVKEKEMHLDKLQQVEVYRRLHNVEDLNTVTAAWKTGCQEALRDLLGKLKEHATIDMPMLLQNLKVPANLISYNANEDSLT